jgi:hypothetical protein
VNGKVPRNAAIVAAHWDLEAGTTWKLVKGKIHGSAGFEIAFECAW